MQLLTVTPANIGLIGNNRKGMLAVGFNKLLT